jgi:hypothetical protein
VRHGLRHLRRTRYAASRTPAGASTGSGQQPGQLPDATLGQAADAYLAEMFRNDKRERGAW